MVAISGVKKAIFDRLCKQLEKIGQQMNGGYSFHISGMFENVVDSLLTGFTVKCQPPYAKAAVTVILKSDRRSQSQEKGKVIYFSLS